MTATSTETPHVRLPAEIQDLVAAGTISLHAGWLYGLLLAHINYRRGDAHVWPSRGTLAKRMGFKNSRAVDRYLDELVGAGLVEKERRRNGQVNESNRYTLLMVSWPKQPAGGSAQPDTTLGINRIPPVVSDSTPELDEPQLDEEEPDPWGIEPNRSPSTRFAPSGAGDGDSQTERLPNQRRPAPQETGSWWLDDRDTFQSIMGERIESKGVKDWNRGTFPAEAVYDALRQRKDNQIDRPGSYVASLMDKPDEALENWMLREGFKFVDEPSG
ncbi:helix-turn-helix domain-containing protein [Micromonospora sp. NPDC049891]|uniref:helix-turn-helix domain-containing protein n=1 Tax=Micromonospora sp. NPDC049891 TaxID=3155655 RepID=UPI0033EB994D